MQVVTIDGVIRPDGALARIGVIGSCRVHGPVRALVDTGRAKAVAFPFNTYTHTPQEALQYLTFCLGRQVVPLSLEPLVFGRTGMRYPSQGFIGLVAGLDLIIAEISSQSHLTAAGFAMQQNYFSTNFLRSGGKPYLDWWRTVVRQDVAQQKASAELIESGLAEELWKREVVSTAATGESGDTEFHEALTALVAAHPARWLFVSHFNFSTETTVPARDRNIALLAEFHDRTGAGFFDPSPFVIAKGRETALKAGGKDTYHYEPDFEPELAKSLADAAKAVLGAEPDTIERHVLPGNLTAPDRRLLDLEDSNDLRAAALMAAQNGDEPMTDALGRRLLDLDPTDVQVSLSVARAAVANGQWRAALVYAEHVMSLDPANPGARHVKAEALDALGEGNPVETLEGLLAASEPDRLGDFCRRALRQYPAGTEIRVRMASEIQALEEVLQKAREDGADSDAADALDRLKALDVANADTWIDARRALVHRLMISMREAVDAHDEDAALADAGSLVRIGAIEADARLVQGRILLARGDARAAAVAFEAAVAVQPDRAFIWINLARALLKSEELVDSATAFVRALGLLTSEDSPALQSEARSSLRGMASGLIRRAREVESEGDRVAAFQAYELAATAMGDEGDLDSLCSALRRASLLHVIAMEKAEDAELEAAIRDHLTIDPHNPRVLAIAGRFNMKLRSYERALGHWEQLARQEPDASMHHLQVARCLDWMGMTDGMLAAAARCLDLDPGNLEAVALAAKSTAMVAELE